jgi:hypothetical protein
LSSAKWSAISKPLLPQELPLLPQVLPCPKPLRNCTIGHIPKQRQVRASANTRFRLDGEIGLPESDDLFGRVAVFDNQLAGVAGELKIFHAPFVPQPISTIFAELSKMVRGFKAAVLKGERCPVQKLCQIAPLDIFQNKGKFERRPILASVRAYDFYILESLYSFALNSVRRLSSVYGFWRSASDCRPAESSRYSRAHCLDNEFSFVRR